LLPTTEFTPFEGKATPEQIHMYQHIVSVNFAATIIAKAVSKLLD
jgi:hypothetical protein